MRLQRAALPAFVPWLVLGAALVLATMPAWRPLVFGTALTLDDLLSLRCLSG
ncbi:MULTISPECIES: hypothetical protein [Methylobacterium]|uniref:Uncharacterized protein n=1 Tax=Methylobacterium brachiatum TaxID=269660 RepID=A0AAJ1WW08_9HYPH|nr:MULTISPECIES: hypothetical protein [Methylobacterium]EIZ83956.1 hypothetical protein WYO_3488 [Methylobacterium sp. GXF4]MCB4803042.1 hypothetical protein [Methylobacterium brachiatum]MDF2602324.1 hypothetical protein [Methylobacterium brachiatum]MDH2308971.1 hypothetical protein [Methylobacterium brachiatum]MDQ0543762.1 hypothetical protein [Methylobacterium brachiatum]